MITSDFIFLRSIDQFKWWFTNFNTYDFNSYCMYIGYNSDKIDDVIKTLKWLIIEQKINKNLYRKIRNTYAIATN